MGQVQIRSINRLQDLDDVFATGVLPNGTVPSWNSVNGRFELVSIPTGPQGPPGPQGPAGPTGATGPQGPAGATGATGAQGPIGNTGLQGPIGNTGPAGTPGSRWFTGSGAPAGTLAGSVVGDWYLDQSSGDYYEKTGASAWTLRGNLKGPTGNTGAQGPTGNTGATGPQGPIGNTGATGPQGIQGPTGPQGPAGPSVVDDTNLPTRLRSQTADGVGASVSDWNSATQNGWYQGQPGTANAPTSGNWYIGYVVTHRAAGSQYITQEVWQFVDVVPQPRFRRACLNSSWSAWVRADSGALLDYQERGDVIGITNNSAATDYGLMQGPNIPCDGATPLQIEFGCAFVTNQVASAHTVIELFDNGADVGRLAQQYHVDASTGGPMYGSTRYTPSAGNHSFLTSVWVSAGNANLYGSSSSTRPMWHKVSRL